MPGLLPSITASSYVCDMERNLSDERDRDRRAALRDYSSSHMSNTKWRTVFSRLAELGIWQIVVKFIGSDDERRIQLPWLHAPGDFVDSLEFGPFPLVAIEWVEVPANATFPRTDNVPARQHAQDLSAVRSALETLGKQLPLQDTATGLRIIGHMR